MKPDIHPTYYPNAKVHCACGHSFETGSTKEKLDVEICSQCHPFYTGEEKIIDSAGRVERFKARRAEGASRQVQLKEQKLKKKEKKLQAKKKEKK